MTIDDDLGSRVALMERAIVSLTTIAESTARVAEQLQHSVRGLAAQIETYERNDALCQHAIVEINTTISRMAETLAARSAQDDAFMANVIETLDLHQTQIEPLTQALERMQREERYAFARACAMERVLIAIGEKVGVHVQYAISPRPTDDNT